MYFLQLGVGEAVSGMSRIFGPGGSEAYAQETWPSVKGDSGAVSDLCSGTPQTILDSCWPSGRTCLLTMYSPEMILACRLAVAARTATSCSSHLFRNLLTKPLFRHALKHSNASITSSPRRFLSGVMRFLALLKAHSNSQGIAGQANTSRAQRCRVRKASSVSGS